MGGQGYGGNSSGAPRAGSRGVGPDSQNPGTTGQIGGEAGSKGVSYRIANGRQAIVDRNYATRRSREISGEIENATGDENEFDRLARMAETGIDKGEHDTGRAVAESWARRGLGGSGMARGEGLDVLQQAAQQRASSLDQARAAAIASQRADLSQEQAGLIGVQTSDINAQRLALEEQARYEAALAAAMDAFGQGLGRYGAKTTETQVAADAGRPARGGVR